MRDPYEVLGVDRSAGDAEIKSAFRRLAAQHHPDRNPDDPQSQQRFSELNTSYQILSDPQKRAAWDRFGEAAFRPGGAFANVDFSSRASLEALFGELLSAFGVQRGRGGDVKVRVSLSFEEAALGCNKEVTYDVQELCPRCSGTGGEPRAGDTECTSCSGRGRVRSFFGLGPLAMERPCPRCHGTGRRPLRDCTTCRGSGIVGARRTQVIAIPAGIETGTARTLKAQGSRSAPGRSPGDLVVEVQVAEHPVFRRTDDDLNCVVKVTLAQATLGAEIEVPTIQGTARLRLPAATQPGTVLRMRGKGLPHRFGVGHGDQLVEVNVEIPRGLSNRARRLITELAEELGPSAGNGPRTLRDRLKDWLT